MAVVAASRGPADAARCEKGLLEGNLEAAWWGASRGGCAQLARVPYGYGCRLRGQQAAGGQQAAEGRGMRVHRRVSATVRSLSVFDHAVYRRPSCDEGPMRKPADTSSEDRQNDRQSQYWIHFNKGLTFNVPDSTH